MECGRQLYGAERYSEAAEAFRQVINSCPCGIHVREKPCLCKNILGGIGNDSLRHELKKTCICSAKSERRCGNATHIDAFDSLAAVYEKEDCLEQSISCAEQMINLSPREPKGYLRLGKVLRLQGLPNLAYHVYKTGAGLVEEKHPNHALLQKLKDQEAKLTRLMSLRVDPVAKLPFELVSMIFRQVDFRTLCRCLSVCKTWKTVLTGKQAQQLWRIQHYTYHRRIPKSPVLPKTLMTYAFFAGNGVTDLSIDNCWRFGLKTNSLPNGLPNNNSLSLILSRCKQLKHLKLRGGGAQVTLDGLFNIQLPALESFYLGYGIRLPAHVLVWLLKGSPNIRELSIFDLIGRSTEQYVFSNFPVLKNLKTIRLANGAQRIHVNMSLFLGSNAVVRPLQLAAAGKLVPEFRPETIRELYLEAYDSALILSELPDCRGLTGIQKFSLNTRDPLRMDRFEALLRPSFTSGSIEELSLSPFPLATVDLNNPEMDWFRGDSLSCLSLTGLTLDGRGNPSDALVDVVSRFPNLHCLNINRECIPPPTLARIVSQTRVRTIYHQHGYTMEEVRTWAARKYGAQIIDGCVPSPAQHPDRPMFILYVSRSMRRLREN
ncbi:hypothetical protein DL766_000593 [Monosporascus sp. MC13-8B]|uniref:F-box domain-containing protein n=1 Tax=Monosporascus cannonballus TaxID=155416 RepID=A0ABY0HJA2_9PEZI|nr:hypothetical protein DL762_000640 [Monosporascus cannonballus]RYP01415.1 hypothetical protein DL763_000225 [Monosporascus cannonballus]RYP39051.1 hypothetical protein DL766_000593 [Monosporascus sp. MC13-8B]